MKKYKPLNAVMVRMGVKPFRLFTDVPGDRFWTLVLETEVESLSAFADMQPSVMADPEAQRAMSGYHDLVVKGRRDIYKIED
ncbi:MAG: hypothetical protein ABIF09_09915 [Gemmatimonadota bacterium]